MHFWSKFGNTDFNWWWLIIRTNSHAQNGGKSWILSSIWPWLILVKTVDELSRGQAHDWRTHRHTDIHTHTHRQWQYPKAKTGLGNKRMLSAANWHAAFRGLTAVAAMKSQPLATGVTSCNGPCACGPTDGLKPIYTPNNFVVLGYNLLYCGIIRQNPHNQRYGEYHV